MSEIILIPASVSKTGRTLMQNGSKIYVTSECCGLSIMDSGLTPRGAYAMYCNGCEKELAPNPRRWASAVYNVSSTTGKGDDEDMFRKWILFMFGLADAKIEVRE